MTTMADVARLAGVSPMTVSNVLNGKDTVRPHMRERVMAAVDTLGYEVNLTARGLRAGRTGTVALVVPYLEHAYYGELAGAIDRQLAATGRHLVVEQSRATRSGELTALSLARLQRYDGVLLSVQVLEAHELERLRHTVPIVVLGEQRVPDRFDTVTLDNEHGGFLATTRMIDSGARRVAIMGGTEVESPFFTRTLGWRRACGEAGLRTSPDLIRRADRHDSAGGLDAVRRMLSEGVAFDAIFAVTDALAHGALAGLAEAGRHVPDDVQIVGFDNLIGSEFTTPGLTTVDPGRDATAAHAVRLLGQRLEDVDGRVEHVVSPVDLVERSTTRPRAGGVTPNGDDA